MCITKQKAKFEPKLIRPISRDLNGNGYLVCDDSLFLHNRKISNQENECDSLPETIAEGN